MKVGDLVKLKSPATRKVFLVTEWRINWFKVLGCADWQRIADFEVINESR
jgi:hypothetical protein